MAPVLSPPWYPTQQHGQTAAYAAQHAFESERSVTRPIARRSAHARAPRPPRPRHVHGHSIMHCKAPVWVKPNLGEAQLGHQASAEYKLRFCLHLQDVYFSAVYSAGSETERVALKKRSETQNRSTCKSRTSSNRNTTETVVANVTWRMLGLKDGQLAAVRDLWLNETVVEQASSHYAAAVAPMDSLALRISVAAQ